MNRGSDPDFEVQGFKGCDGEIARRFGGSVACARARVGSVV